MFIQHIALVPEAAGIDPSEIARVSAALQKQMTRDLSPAWGVYATVDAFPRLEDVPIGYWPILVTRDIGSDSGLRIDRDGMPYAQVEYSPYWSIDASRACLEMLVNPFGKRTVSAPSPRSDQGRVEVVLEVCAPCADVLCAYSINDVVVSDFCLPAFYEEGPLAAGKRLSLNGSLGAPFRVLPGGHLTWFDVVSESYWRRSYWSENPIDTRLGRLALAASQTLPARLSGNSPAHEAFQARVALARQHARRVSEVRAMRLRASFLSSGLSEPEPPTQAARKQRAPEPEQFTVVEVTEDPAPRASSMPPPLPPRASKQPAATASATSSMAPVSIPREADRAPRPAPVMMIAIGAIGALAVAAALALVWRANDASREAMAPASTSAMEAATVPAPAPVAAPAEPPLAAATAPVAERPKKEQVSEATATATEKAKPIKRRVEPFEQLAPPAPPLVPEKPEPVAAAVASKPAVAAPTKPAPSSIDDLIDTRR